MTSRSKRSIRLEVKPWKGNEKILGMLDLSWKKRFTKLREHVTQLAAQSTLNSVKERLPVGEEYRELNQSLSVARIDGLGPDETGYAIQSKSKKRKLQALNPERVILFVRAKRSAKRVAPEIQVLIEHSPWTMDLLPFTPRKRDAQIIYRKVTVREALTVEKQRKKDRKKWTMKLSRKGRRVSKTKLGLGKGQVRAIPDLAYTALNLELGLGGVKARPAWRTALGGLKRKTIPTLLKKEEYGRTVSDPDYKAWMGWPKKTAQKISIRVVKTFVPFQKRLGFKP